MNANAITKTIGGAVILLIIGVSAMAQERATGPGDFKIRSIRKQLMVAEDVRALASGTGVAGSAANKKWLRIEVEFDSAPDWADDVLMKYFVLVGKGRDAKLLVGEITHVNVQKGTRHVSAMFAHPNTVERYGKGNVEAVAVQLFHQSRLIDQNSDPATNQRWWEQYTPTTGQLLPPHYSPWASVAHERYEAAKMP
jgi:hypothetical protein